MCVCTRISTCEGYIGKRDYLGKFNVAVSFKEACCQETVKTGSESSTGVKKN